MFLYSLKLSIKLSIRTTITFLDKRKNLSINVQRLKCLISILPRIGYCFQISRTSSKLSLVYIIRCRRILYIGRVASSSSSFLATMPSNTQQTYSSNAIGQTVAGNTKQIYLSSLSRNTSLLSGIARGTILSTRLSPLS